MKKIGLAFCVMILTACSGVPVSTDYSQDFDFSKVSSYAWLLPAKPMNTEVDNDLVRERVVDAVDAQFTAKGLARAADAAKASVLVTYQLGQEDKIAIDNFGSWHTQFGYYPCYRCGYRPGFGYFGHSQFYDNDLWVRNYKESTLMIDIIDPNTKRLLWRGITKRAMPTLETPEERRLYVLETVSAILAEFPPRLASSP
ncbi:DUF4136 domain-containing protein [Zhongshania arctica]|mgnify:CR=1 FL=1|uniref:DUF4136 domain-containing protein n=1 Tax=Zhongshania arctica TaxID=3238302 RepID=A0ABV3TXW6_9GAMM|tara:strand:- start:690 stop:1286 length:597 start_codon:yes stop_codon:yes gene_type:complete